MGLKEKTIGSLKWNTIATILTMIIGILQVAILTHLLDKTDFGLIAIATMVISFTDIFAEMGITAALIHKQNISRDEYSSVYWLNIAMSLILCLITILIAPLVALFYNEPNLILIIRLLALKIVFSAFGKIFQTIKTKKLEFGFISKIRILTSLVGLIIATVFAFYGYGVLSLVYGQLAQIFFNQGIYAVVGLKQVRVRLHFSFTEVKDVLSIGSFQLGTQLLDFIAARLDVFLIGRFFSMEQLGVYNMAKELIVKPFLIINSITTNVFSAAFARIQSDIDLVITNYKRLIKTVSMVSMPIYAIMFVFADLLVSILYAPSFSDVAVFIRIFALMGICSSLTSQGSAIMIAMGRTDLGLKWTIVRIIMSSVTLLATVCISIYAVAYGQTAIAIISLLVYFAIVIKPILFKVSISQYFSIFGGLTVGTILITTPFALLNYMFDIPIIYQIFMIVLLLMMFYLFVRCFQKKLFDEVMGLFFFHRIPTK